MQANSLPNTNYVNLWNLTEGAHDTLLAKLSRFPSAESAKLLLANRKPYFDFRTVELIIIPPSNHPRQIFRGMMTDCNLQNGNQKAMINGTILEGSGNQFSFKIEIDSTTGSATVCFAVLAPRRSHRSSVKRKKRTLTA